MRLGGSAGDQRGSRLQAAARCTLVGLLVAGAGVLTPIVLATVASTPAAAESLTPVVANLPGPLVTTTGPSGEIFIGESNGDLDVWSPTATGVFDTNVPADTLTTIASEEATYSGLTYHDGDLWISTSTGSNGDVQVISPTSTTLYGVTVPADTITTIITDDSESNISPSQVAFDSAGDLFVATPSNFAGDGVIDVLPVSSGTLYGQAVTANTVTALVTGLNQPDGVALDSSNNLYYADESLDNVSVLPASSGTIFGTPVTADTSTELYGGFVGVASSDGLAAGALAFDSSGNLYDNNNSTGVVALSNSSGTLFGTSVTADTPTALNLVTDALDIAFDSSGNLLILDGYDNAVVKATTPTADVTSVSFTGSLDNPTITIHGSGFGTEPTGFSPGCTASGENFPYSEFTMTDYQQGWQAGIGNDCIGFNFTSYSPTEVVATFGSWYTDQEVAGGTQIQGGDTILIGLAGSYITETVPKVTSVVPDTGPDGGGTPVTINGSGFTGATAVDFGPGNPASFAVDSDSQITATAPEGSTGAVDVTVTTPVATSPTSPADQFTYTTEVATDYSCVVPGDNTVSFPVDVTESPAPPTTQYAGASFQETLAAEVTIPAPVSEYYIGQGADALTLESQATTENGLASADGPASGAVDPSSETASATNVPQTFSPLSNAPITYQTTYNPVTWQTGPGTGTVYLTPGDVSIVVTYVVDGTPETDTISCTPPANEGALDTTTVEPAPAAATVQVPTSTPPVQSQVTAGSDDGWTFTVTNPSQTSVTGLQTQVTISDGDPTPPAFDTAAITASGTKGCTVTSPGVLTCTENTLAAGDSDTVNVLVDTTGLTDGTAVTGSASVTSSNAASASDSLGQFSLVTVNNGVDAVGTPGIPVTSSSDPLNQTGGDVTLTLPKKIPGMGSMGAAVRPDARESTVKPPVVGMTLEPLPPSDEPELCPPSDGGCPGDVIDVEGNFSAYVSASHPVKAVIQIYFGHSVPANLSMYMLEFSGKVVKLPACVKTSGNYNTPCVKGKQKTIGSPGALSAQDTVLFTADDPGFSLR